MILVDSNIWISAWRGTSNTIIQKLESLIEDGRVFINPFILTELLQGASSRKHQNQLQILLKPIPVLNLPNNLWNKSAEFFLEFKSKGLSPTTIDCYLATQCLQLDIPIWSLDQIFSKMAKIKDLKCF